MKWNSFLHFTERDRDYSIKALIWPQIERVRNRDFILVNQQKGFRWKIWQSEKKIGESTGFPFKPM